MKENRKLLKEVLKDIRHDMTDREILDLLADSKISVALFSLGKHINFNTTISTHFIFFFWFEEKCKCKIGGHEK